MMKTFGLLSLMFCVLSAVAFAQTEETENKETPEAVKITEFGNVPNGQVRLELDNLFVHLQNDPTATAYIINFGSAREIKRVETLIRDQIRLRRFDSSRIVFMSKISGEELRTEFWLVPNGAEVPDFLNEGESEDQPMANKIVEFGNVPNGYIKMQLDNLFVQLQNDPSATAYIINFGSAREIARVEKLIRNQIRLRRYDALRLVFLNGGNAAKLQTQFWIVPAGAEPPIPEYNAEEPK